MPDIHLIDRTLHVLAVDPNQTERTESETFRNAKERLREDGHYRCWVCGSTDSLQVHHFAAEWSERAIADWDKVKEFVETFDIYGYGRLLKNKPITSPGDVRCLMVLCQKHHTGVDHADGRHGTGIHAMDFPTWILQRLAREGVDPVPQPGESGEQALKRIEKEVEDAHAKSS